MTSALESAKHDGIYYLSVSPADADNAFEHYHLRNLARTLFDSGIPFDAMRDDKSWGIWFDFELPNAESLLLHFSYNVAQALRWEMHQFQKLFDQGKLNLNLKEME